MQRQIETVFSSFACLNASFLDDNTVLGTSKATHGLDLASVREAYRLMFSGAPASIVQTVGNCTARLVTRMRQVHYDRPEMLRFILIIMEVRDHMYILSACSAYSHRALRCLCRIPYSSIRRNTSLPSNASPRAS